MRWDKEPAVCGYRSFRHRSSRHDREIAVPVCASPAVVSGVGVVVASYDGRVRFLSADLERVFWERRLDSAIYASLVVDQARGRVVVAATSGQVTCFDLHGRTVWATHLNAPVYATPAILPDAGVLVVAAFNSVCLGVDLITGKQTFTAELPRPWYAALGGSSAHRDPYASPAVTADGDAIVCCAEHVLCLRPDGTRKWTREIGDAVRASPVTLHATGEVAVCSVDGRCTFLASASGDECGEIRLSAKITASPAISNGILAIGTCDGAVTGVDVRHHVVAWASKDGAPHDHTSFTVLPSGDFVATSVRGNAECRQTDGRFLWETSQLLGLSEHDPAMHITPTAAPNGYMYCGSYSGVLYRFRFRPSSAADRDWGSPPERGD